MKQNILGVKPAGALLVLALLSQTPAVHAEDLNMTALLRQGSAEWNAQRTSGRFVQPDLSGANLKGRRLRGFDFSRSNLTGADLSHSDLGRSDFHDALLQSAHFDGAALSDTRFNGADMISASLAGALCDRADFSGARMISSTLRRADLSRALLHRADLRGADLREANLQKCDLQGADLRAVNMTRANVGGMMVDGASVSEETVLPDGKRASREWADSRRAVFIETKPRSQDEHSTMKTTRESGETARHQVSSRDDLSVHGSASASPAISAPVKAWQPDPPEIAYDAGQVDLLKTNVLKWNRMRKAQPTIRVNLHQAVLKGRMLSYADLNHADLVGASLRGADLSLADLRNALLRGADLRTANLDRADLRDADLREATLLRANLDRARFDGAIISAGTVLDSGRNATASWAADKHAIFDQDGIRTTK
jgi:uncharacterized protein YjbI with pentapeptide repeats